MGIHGVRRAVGVLVLAAVQVFAGEAGAARAAGGQTPADPWARAGADTAALEGAGLVIHHAPGARRLAAWLLESAERQPPLAGLPADVLHRGPPVQVYLAGSPARFDALTGGVAPEWGAGIAFPDAGVIVLPGYSSERAAPHELPRILRHELAHVALRRFLAPARPPRWFDEGYARWAAGEWGWDDAWQLRLAFAMNRAPPLDSIALAWPSGERDARVAYLLATTTVVYLVERSGERGLRLFLERWKADGALDPALRDTYGLTLGQFEEDWRHEVRSRFGWALFFSQTLVFWLGVSLLVLLLHGRRRRRDAIRLERLRATEPPDSPAYWLGEDDGTRHVEGDAATEDTGRNASGRDEENGRWTDGM
ncbi:MAG TPA: hypothetical protein VF188_02280 [Longimicrobiales bacterium]